ncbi:MAG TPA: EamA family transporter [Pelotomaculum sp.]|nr:EamA family transporter [Pelotomaculum sp.]
MDCVTRLHWRIWAPIFVIISGVFWGTIGLFSHYLSASGLPALQITELRCLIVTAALVCINLLSDKKQLKIRLRDIWMFIGTGVCSIAFFNIYYFICISESTLSVACTLLHTAPCFVMLLSCILFHEKFTVPKAVSTLLAILGCAYITGVIGGNGSPPISRYALIAGLCSGFGYALYSIIGRFALQKYSWLTVITYTFLFAAIALLPLSDLTTVIKTTLAYRSVAVTALLLGLLSTLFPFLLYTKGLEHMETGKAALLTFVEPMVATIISAIVFHESFLLNNAIGIVMIVLSIIILNSPLHTRHAKTKIHYFSSLDLVFFRTHRSLHEASKSPLTQAYRLVIQILEKHNFYSKN